MAQNLGFYTVDLTHDLTGKRLPFMASPAQLREVVVAAPSIRKKLAKKPQKGYHASAWDALEATHGKVSLASDIYQQLLQDFEAKNLALANADPEDADLCRKLEAEVDAITDEANHLLQSAVAKAYAPIYQDMSAHRLPMPAAVSMAAFTKAEKALVAELDKNEEINLPQWASIALSKKTRAAAINFKKGKKDWVDHLNMWGWLVDGGIVAVGGAVLAGLGAMTPIGWAAAGAMLLTVFVDKWQGNASKGARFFGWCRRTWHGFYDRGDSVRKLNWKSWKPWFSMAIFALIGAALAFGAYKLFMGALKLTSAVFATIYTMCGISYTTSSLFAGFSKAMGHINIHMWFHKIRNYNKKECDVVQDDVKALINDTALDAASQASKAYSDKTLEMAALLSSLKAAKAEDAPATLEARLDSDAQAKLDLIEGSALDALLHESSVSESNSSSQDASVAACLNHDAVEEKQSGPANRDALLGKYASSESGSISPPRRQLSLDALLRLDEAEKAKLLDSSGISKELSGTSAQNEPLRPGSAPILYRQTTTRSSASNDEVPAAELINDAEISSACSGVLK